MKESLSIIIPAYNEEKRIKKTLDTYRRFFEEEKKKKTIRNFEIVVVINNTQDRTEEIVKKFSKKYPEIRYLNFKQGGKGFAIIEGFKDALKRNKDLIGFVDADMATLPESFYDLIKNIGDYDGIIASRYMKGAIVNPKPSIQRIIVSRIFNILIRTLFLMNYKDTQCGAKLFKRNVIKETINRFSITKWAFDVDLLHQMKKKNFKIKEYPTIWSDKKYSKINFVKAGPKMAFASIRLRILDSKLNKIVNLYDKINDIFKKNN